MAKVGFSKLTPLKTINAKSIWINNEEIVILQYLPVDEKAQMIERILAAVFDDTGFASPLRINIYLALEIIRSYTNINITDKMIENASKTYDSLVINNIIDEVIKNIPEKEYNDIQTLVYQCINSIETYNNSFVGMIRTISQDYNATKVNVDEIMESLDQPDKIGLVKEILDKIG